jgi:heme/copper-type cytochrome/quinol oxidase subunit 1
VDSTEIISEMQRAQADFHQLISEASAGDLRRRSHGTRWTNRQLLFHMVFGYVIVRTLLPLVHVLGRYGRSRRFAATLNACHRPFHLINYLGSCGGGQILTPQATVALLDRTVRALHRNLSTETDESLARTMHFPTAWDPYFKPTMSVLDVYHFATQHFNHHRRQLTLRTPGDA